MKKLFLLSALIVISLVAKSQTSLSLSEGESTLIYSLPKTVFCIEVETEKTTQKAGVFYRYSERYLATNKVITEDKVTYKIKSIQVKTRAIADPARTYAFVPGSGKGGKLSVNSQGILCGVNAPAETEKATSSVSGSFVTDSPLPNTLLPLGEEYMMAGSQAKLAEGAAKQIYRIRESRLGLLTADVDKLPADGESLKAMLAGMNKMEAELTELFVGKTVSETRTQTLYLTPSAAVSNEVLFRLSALKGLVPADDLSGAPYYISIVPSTIGIGSKSKTERNELYYVLPASTQLSIGDGVNTIYSNQYFVPQFGKIVAIPESTFKQSNVKIQLDSQTGRLLSVE